MLFSSAAGVFGTAGQGNYAAANAFLDALAAQSPRRQGCPRSRWPGARGTETGMLSGADAERMARSGCPPLTVEQGVALFDAALTADDAAVLALRLDLSVVRASRQIPPLLRGLIRTRSRRSAVASSEAADTLVRRLSGLAEDERRDVLLEMVRDQVAAVLGHADGAEVEPDRQFKDLGFDSLTAVELRNRLTAVTGLRLPATLVFDYPTPTALAGYLLDELFDGGRADPVAGAPRSSRRSPTTRS